MNKGAYATSGAKLVERGYAAIPIIPGTKRPGELKLGEWVGKSNWREEYTRRLPSRFEMQIWSASDAGVCVVCGPASKYLVGVDIDTDDDAVKSAILSALPPSTIVKRGQKGATYFYRAPMIDKSPSWNLPYADRRLAPDGKLAKYRACDLIGPGRQTLLPPTIHPDTKAPYVWIGPDALEDMNPDELPELLPEHVEAITAALLPFGYNAEPERDPNRPKFEASGRADDFDRPIHRKLNDEAINDFDRWVPHLGLKRCRRTHGGWEAVAEWRASNGGQAFEKRKFNLKFHRSGIVDFGGGPRPYTPLNCVMAALSLRDSDGLDSAFRWLSDAMGWNTAPVVDMPIKGPSRLASVAPEPTEIPVAAYGLSVVEVKGGEPVAEGEGEPQDTATLDALEVLTHCPGLVGEVIDWIVGTARRPNRVMALGVAATVIGTLIGRRVAGPTRSATHLYVACLAPTGSGKQHPLDCLSLLLRSAKAEHLIGPSEFISMPAVINMLTRKPLCLSAQDEFGSFLKRINSRNASGFEQGISKIMRMIWGISFGDYMTPEWAGRAAEPIFAPALSIYGVSTPDEFYRGLQGSELENGFLNRFIVLKTGRTDARVPPLEQGRVPDALAAGLGELFRWGADENSLTTVRVNDPNLRATPQILRWADSSAEDCYAEFEKHVERLIERDEETKHYLGRAAEIAVRLATIRSVGRCGPYGEGPMVDRGDVEWGRDIALICGARMAEDARGFIADTDRQRWANKILRVIRQKQEARPRDIQRALRCALKSADVQDHLRNLEEAGLISPVKGELRGRLATIAYRYRGASS